MARKKNKAKHHTVTAPGDEEALSAVQLKDKGNEYFSASDYENALKYYSKVCLSRTYTVNELYGLFVLHLGALTPTRRLREMPNNMFST